MIKMMKPTNGQGKPQKIKFPIKYTLKAIFDNSIDKKEHTQHLENMFAKLKIEYGRFSDTLSSNGKYISISVPVKVVNRDTFDKLYEELRKIPGIKYAL